MLGEKLSCSVVTGRLLWTPMSVLRQQWPRRLILPWLLCLLTQKPGGCSPRKEGSTVADNVFESKEAELPTLPASRRQCLSPGEGSYTTVPSTDLKDHVSICVFCSFIRWKMRPREVSEFPGVAQLAGTDPGLSVLLLSSVFLLWLRSTSWSHKVKFYFPV